MDRTHYTSVGCNWFNYTQKHVYTHRYAATTTTAKRDLLYIVTPSVR